MKVIRIWYLDVEGKYRTSLFGEFVVPDRLARLPKSYLLPTWATNPKYLSWKAEIAEWMKIHYGLDKFDAHWYDFDTPEDIPTATKRYTEEIGHYWELLAMTTLKESK